MNELSENKNENLEPATSGSGNQKAGQNSTEPGNGRTSKRSKTAPPLVERVTALRGLGIASPRDPKSTLRCQTHADIYNKGAEIPYVKLEAAARDLVCSLMERQDRMNEEIFYKLNDLAFRVGDLEEDLPATGSAAGKTQ